MLTFEYFLKEELFKNYIKNLSDKVIKKLVNLYIPKINTQCLSKEEIIKRIIDEQYKIILIDYIDIGIINKAKMKYLKYKINEFRNS